MVLYKTDIQGNPTTQTGHNDQTNRVETDIRVGGMPQMSDSTVPQGRGLGGAEGSDLSALVAP